MEELSTHYNDKLKIVNRLNELARDTPEELESVLLDVNNEKLEMKTRLEQMRAEVAEWKHQLVKAQRFVQHN